MPIVIFLIFLASIYPAKADDNFPYGKLPLWKIDTERRQIYRNFCWNQKTGEKERECCIGFDVECADTREMWIHFPQGINSCEKLYGYENNSKKYYLTYCSGNPDPVTKEVQIEECPINWSDNSEAKFLYFFPVDPTSHMFGEDSRHFHERGTSGIAGKYKLGQYRLYYYYPFMLGWGKQDEFLKYNRFSRKDVKDMVCVYGPFDTKE